MKQDDATEEYVLELLRKQVEDEWKVITKECIMSKDVPLPLRMPFLNYARTMNLLYDNNIDGFTFVKQELKDHIKSSFLHAMSI